jgi:STE24 endopeptidase
VNTSTHLTADPPVEHDPHHEAHRSQSALRVVSVWESLATACALVVCVTARLPHRVLDATGVRGWALELIVVVTVVGGVRALSRAPFTLHHLSSSALRRWAGEEMRVGLAAVAVGATVSLPLYALIRATPLWWLWAGLMFATVTVVWQIAAPLALRAQAGPLTPGSDELADRVQALAERAGVDLGGGVVVAGKSGKSGDGRCNAYVVGLGPTRRLVLEQAVAAWPPELVDQVVAHELGHWRLGHSSRRLPLTVLCQLATLAAAAAALSYGPLLALAGVTDAGDPRSYPFLLVLGALLALPARCLLAGRDRAQERAADRFALDLLDLPQDFTAMLHRAAAEASIATDLTWWRRATASHPSIDERAAACPAAAKAA